MKGPKELEITLKELNNAELIRAESIFVGLIYADFVQIRKIYCNTICSKLAIRKNWFRKIFQNLFFGTVKPLKMEIPWDGHLSKTNTFTCPIEQFSL